MESAEDSDLEQFVRTFVSGPQAPEPGAPAPGNDYLSARDGRRDLVDCGSGRDYWYNADSFDVVRNCEVPARI